MASIKLLRIQFQEKMTYHRPNMLPTASSRTKRPERPIKFLMYLQLDIEEKKTCKTYKQSCKQGKFGDRNACMGLTQPMPSQN